MKDDDEYFSAKELEILNLVLERLEHAAETPVDGAHQYLCLHIGSVGRELSYSKKRYFFHRLFGLDTTYTKAAQALIEQIAQALDGKSGNTLQGWVSLRTGYIPYADVMNAARDAWLRRALEIGYFG
ncbi:aminotransferase [Burkholderia phage BcepSauron]|uniref:Aminotransferase n=1 Tax=Burkholderia phage BcepSauron TaxID=2530033 RepID=A0A482MM28_9CAUD|nr:aminotransferase [Burkholderia phage BcepSauron]QBQ74725.1 aminotransferase [Burkholderia phage BcepSauron]